MTTTQMTNAQKKSGILLLDKQAGMTSFDCIRELKRVWKRKDLGHGGTLDRFATGLLPILVGEGLKLVRFFLETYPQLPTYWKSYAGIIELGIQTETGDAEGAKLQLQEPPTLTIDKVEAAMQEFLKKPYDQVPPAYCAKKISGQRASDLARAGVQVDLKPVRVTIRSFRCLSIDGPLIHFEVDCSKGTYVRRLAEDLALKLGTIAHVRCLRRTAVGSFQIADALTLDTVITKDSDQCILDMEKATAFLPSFPLIGGESDEIVRGKLTSLSVRLANSGLAPNVYCAHAGSPSPAALLELTAQKRVRFLRAVAR